MAIVEPPAGGLIGNSNYNLYSEALGGPAGVCADNSFAGVSVAIEVEHFMLAPPSGPSSAREESYGFAFQVNCLPPDTSSAVSTWQQYFMTLQRTGQELRWGINTWNEDTTNQVINQGGHLAQIPSPFVPGYAYIPAGYKFLIVLLNDDNNNVNGAAFGAWDENGFPLFTPCPLIEILTQMVDQNGNQVTEDYLTPIVDIQFVIGGYSNGADTKLLHGGGKITYSASDSTPLTVRNTWPPFTVGVPTGESSNVTYGELVSTPSTQIVQPFGVEFADFLYPANGPVPRTVGVKLL